MVKLFGDSLLDDYVSNCDRYKAIMGTHTAALRQKQEIKKAKISKF